MSRMKTIRIPKPGEVIVTHEEIPVPQQDEALLEILYAGICGSDVSIFKGTFLYTTYPIIPGHEFSARVVEAKENTYGIKPGMIVTGIPYYNCGSCYTCRRGHTNCCENNQTLGVHRDGVFRQYFTMPLRRLRDGKGLGAKELALIEPYAVSYHAVKRVNVQKGERVLIVGSGPIGIFAAMAAKRAGAHVTISDLSLTRLEKAKEMGADEIMPTSSREDFASGVKRLSGGDGFDVCIECAGLPETFQNCIDAAAHRGRVALVGICNQNLDFAFMRIQTKELDVFGSRNSGNADFEELIDLAQKEDIGLTSMISKVYPFDGAAGAFDDLTTKDHNMIKTLLDLQG